MAGERTDPQQTARQPPGKRFSRFGYFHVHLLNFTFSAEDLKQNKPKQTATAKSKLCSIYESDNDDIKTEIEQRGDFKNGDDACIS